MQFRKIEQKLLYQNDEGGYPFVKIHGFEKTYGKPGPHDAQAFLDSLESWAFVCAYKNAFSIAKVPLKLYRKVKKAGQIELEPITEHVFLDLLENVNPYFNRFELMALLGIWQGATGNAYWYLANNQLGIPSEIWP